MKGVAATASELALSPTALRAVTEQEYSRPLVRPVTTMGEPEPVLEGLSRMPPRQLALYCEIGEPPSESGGVKTTVSARSPGVICVIVGDPGAVGAGAEPPPPPQAERSKKATATTQRGLFMPQIIIGIWLTF